MYEMPDVEHLDTRINSVALADLAGGPLNTWIRYDGIQIGDFVRINWRGTTVDGAVRDIFAGFEILSLDANNRWLFQMQFSHMEALQGGVVFYSYQAQDANGNYLDESPRRFFYVDRVADGMWALPVAHLQDAHDLVVDVTQLRDEGVLLATPPYIAMAEGDTVFLQWEPYYAEFAPGDPIELDHVVTAADVGLPLPWHLEVGDVYNYMYGYALLRYHIVYADGSISRSPEQRFEIVYPDASTPTPTPLLTAPIIVGHTGGSLDPDADAYQQGIWLLAESYSELDVGDSLVLYVQGPDTGLRALRADVSSLDSGYLAFHLNGDWLRSETNRGKVVSFSYEYARPGAQRRSHALTVALQRPLRLPLPIVGGAVPEPGGEAHQGMVHPRDLQRGAQVRIPAEAELGEGELPAPQVTLHWEGHGDTGSVVVPQPASGDRRLFNVPRTAIAANLGQRVDVYYTVTRSGEPPRVSQTFDLRVMDYGPESYPLIQVLGVENQRLALHDVPANGALCVLAHWPFMAEGQWLGIEAEGQPQSGQASKHVLRQRDTEVSEDEYYDGRIEARLPKAFLQGLHINRLFRLTVLASFDEGQTWRSFRSVDIELTV